MTPSSAAAKDSRRRQYRSCDRCRVGKRACNAEYDSVAEAISNKVACSNCRKKGKTCTFQHVLSILGGVPSASATSGHFAAMPTSPALPAEVSSVDEEIQIPDSVMARTDEAGECSALSTAQSVAERGTSSDTTLVRAGLGTVAAATALQTLLAISPTSSTTRMTSTIDRIFLNDGLIRVYEGAAEHALQCWITSSNTPYMLVERSSSPSSSSQQLVYWRICELDRGARALLGHTTTSRERDIMDAFHAVVLAFAAQWTPSWISGLASARGRSENRVRLALWERARDRLQRVANVDSFRVIFALVIFAWTEKPRQVQERAAGDADVDLNGENCALDTSDWQSPAEGSTFLLVAAMRKLLSIKFRIEGRKRRGVSPWNAPGGKVKVAAQTRSAATADGEGHETMAGKIQSDLESKRPAAVSDTTAADASETARMDGTYHMLYWLCVVIDTETSVLRKHPPVVCDEDSEIISCIPFTSPSSCDTPSPARKGIWDDYIIDTSHRKHQSHEFVTSWPSDATKAAATLAFSTPAKVVMFRQISRLQMSFWRRASTQSVEQHIRSGLAIVYHWNQIYGPLIDSLRASHAALPASIQSWYVLLAFPWYLAILLFVEMVQTVDMAGASDAQCRHDRARSGLFPRLRDRACADLTLLIAAIQSTAFTHPDHTFQYVRDSGANLLLTEPWSEILVHSITAVVTTELKLHDGYCSLFQWSELDESCKRIDKCLWALQQLQDRSPSAALAYAQMREMQGRRRRGQLVLQQIPLASPPLAREAALARQSGNAVVGASVESDSNGNGAASSSDRWMECDAISTLDGSILAHEEDPLQSALDTYFASSSGALSLPTPAVNPAPPADVQMLPLGTDQSADLGHLLQMLEQAHSSSHPISQNNKSLLSASMPAAFADPEQLSILETLAELTSRPVLELVSLGSDSTSSSSSSMETRFSFDSLSALAAPDDATASAACAAIAQPTDGMAASDTSCSADSDSDASDAHDAHTARKRQKLSHTVNSCFAPPLAMYPVPVASYTNLGLAPAMAAQEPKYTSMLLQPPPLHPRNHDDLYTDDDDDDLLRYRAAFAARFDASPASSASCS
ncbi:related to regulatory protein alcR [Sporisorium reilianum SRZ2]|uniref:Related to regulatory protein alcR n=1 Tax=Sporisorium reilianum (strain SRZ2) TaxID=999809 RepID=E7A3A4_SPORE|nr:related to regulatory protein alcR [Sporisorium reilianum SRZ2]